MRDLIAYIDPASTALIWQILAGVFVTIGVVLGIWWTKITTFLRTVWVKMFGKKKDSAENAKEPDDEIDEIDEASDETDAELTKTKKKS